MENELKEMISKYSYGKSNLAKKDLDVIYFSSLTNQVGIPNFYDHSGNATEGTCSELAKSCQKEISKKFPNMGVYIFQGTEPEFFRKRSWAGNDSHLANLVLDKDLLGNWNVLNRRGDSRYIEALEDMGAMVVDPSYGKVVPLKGSGYVVDQVIKELPVNNDLIMGHLDGPVPLGFADNGYLVSLQADFNTENILTVKVRDKEELKRTYGLYSLDLNEDMKEFGKVSNIIDQLRRKVPSDIYIPKPETSLFSMVF